MSAPGTHHLDGTEYFADDARADCCGITSLQSENDGFALVRVGNVVVCGSCIVEAGLQDLEPED